MLFTVNCEKDQLAGTPEFGHNNGNFRAVNRLTPNKILAFSRFAIFLLINDCAREDNAFDIKDGQPVIIHLFFSMQGHHILATADFLAHPIENTIIHALILRQEEQLCHAKQPNSCHACASRNIEPTETQE